MTGHHIPIDGYNLDKNGKLVKAQRKRMSVSEKIRQKKSKRVRVVPKGKP
jgi:hypothetical protein